MIFRRPALLLLGTLPISCAAPRHGPEFPLEVSSDHFVGTLRSGPLADPAPKEAGDPWWIGLELAYVERAPVAGSELLSTRTEQVFVERVGRPIATRGELALGVLATDRPATPAADLPVLDERAPVWAGTTTVWRAWPRRPIARAPSAVWDVAEVDLSRPVSDGDAPMLALVLEGDVAPRPEEDETPRSAGAPVRQREHLVLETVALAPGESLRFFLPAPRKLSPAGGYQLRIERGSPPEEPGLAEALAIGRSALERSSARARGVASAPTADEKFRFESGTALPALEGPALRRPALAFLATVARAPLAGDLALDAGPAALESYATALVPVVRGENLDEASLPTLGWALERTAYVWLAGAALDEKRPFEPELAALLVTHAGELGRFPELLRDAVLECDGQAALSKRLVQENRIFLEDADAGARVRAFDWLAGRGAAPDAFDPLGSLADRRAALERMREAAESAK